MLTHKSKLTLEDLQQSLKTGRAPRRFGSGRRYTLRERKFLKSVARWARYSGKHPRAITPIPVIYEEEELDIKSRPGIPKPSVKVPEIKPAPVQTKKKVTMKKVSRFES